LIFMSQAPKKEGDFGLKLAFWIVK
jgi:hypothetical protein